MILVENISFSLKANEKVAIVGANGTGKTTLLRDIFQNNKDSISVAQDVEIGFLSQIHGEMLNENHTIYEEMEEIGYEDCFYGDGICFIEWANLIEEILPKTHTRVTIEKDLEKGFDYRKITIEEIEG